MGAKEPEEMVATHGDEPVVDEPPKKSDVTTEFVEENRGKP